MAWRYSQSSGMIVSLALHHWEKCYAGKGDGKNNPILQNVHYVGPLPRGDYKIIGPPFDDPHMGPKILGLSPMPLTQMFGRTGFFMHSDSLSHPGAASEGCIVTSLQLREIIWDSGDHVLEVVL